MTEQEYIDKLTKDIPLAPNEGELWKKKGYITIVMRYKNEKGSMSFSYDQKTTYSDESYKEDLYVFSECKKFFFQQVKERNCRMKIIEANTDFIYFSHETEPRVSLRRA